MTAARLIADVDCDRAQPAPAFGADGYGRFADVAACAANAGAQFVPVVFGIPAPADLATARIRLTYADSDPMGVETNADGSFVVPDGTLRIWTRPGAAARDGAPVADGGDFLAGGDYGAEEFGFTNGCRSLVYYMEAVRPGQAAGDARILFEVDLNGTGGLVAHDAVIVTAVRLGLTPDFDRDGKIDDADARRLASKGLFRFWINDDDDDGSADESTTGGQDIPGAAPGYSGNIALDGRNPDSGDATADGLRDWTDFFPVLLDVKDVLDVLGTQRYYYYLRHTDGAVNALLDNHLGPESAGAYLRDWQFATDNCTRSVVRVTDQGCQLSNEFLDRIRTAELGVILLEGLCQSRDGALVLEVRDSDQNIVCSRSLPLSLDHVENMFLHRNLRVVAGGDGGAPDRNMAPNYPDSDCSGKQFVFVHGYNVNGDVARGWEAEFFKRMFWSGSNARFHAVSWYGEESQEFVPFVGFKSRNFHANVLNAWQTAPALRDYLADVTAQGNVQIAAHSLGNVVVACALLLDPGLADHFYLLNAALPSEAFDPALIDADMIHAEWVQYESLPHLFAANWHGLFPAVLDARSDLTWRGRFVSLAPRCANLYSSGDPVMEPHPKSTAPSVFEGFINLGNGRFAWAYQEKGKGNTWPLNAGGEETFSSCGGWSLNKDDYGEWAAQDEWLAEDPSFAAQIPVEDLVAMPFFSTGYGEFRQRLFGTGWGDADDWLVDESTWPPDANRWRLLAGAIPAMSLSMGRRPVLAPGCVNADMNASPLKPEFWPDRGGDAWLRRNWLHNDIKNMAYLYTHRAYDHIVELGGMR